MVSELFPLESLEQPSLITPPEDWYFMHGIKDWKKDHLIGIRSPEISCSLHKDGFTRPLRPYGYILALDQGSISRAYDRDVTSHYDGNFKKILSEGTRQKKYNSYSEKELDLLAKNTRKDSHNELWVNGEKTEIIGAYIMKDAMGISGNQSFIKACRKAGIPVREI